MNGLETSAVLKGRNHAAQQLGRVLVLGLGKSGKAAATYCLDRLGSRVASLHVAAGQPSDDAQAFAETCRVRGATVSFDEYDFADAYDLCIASPGIPQTSDFYRNAQAASTELVSEVEFAWRESSSDAKWIAITGTNGKTTTTALCTHLLQTCGMAAVSVGNIGDTCLDAVAEGAAQVFVAEVSSYQLASTRLFAPDVAVLMNITPDHLSWHGGMDAYIQAKRQVFANLAQRSGAWAVLDATNEIVRESCRVMKQEGDGRGYDYIPVGTAQGIQGDMRQACGSSHAAFLRDDATLVVVGEREYALCSSVELQIPGAHNIGNALMAASAALCLGASPEGVSQGLRSFVSLPHRIEACGVVNKVACYNDSKATNVDATLKALAAFEPEKPIVLLGGRDKNTDLSSLVQAACEHCQAVVLYGESRARFQAAFDGADVPVLLGTHMADSLDCALSYASPGGIVLLSPACASFDEFDSFEQRGDVFKQLVAQKAQGS